MGRKALDTKRFLARADHVPFSRSSPAFDGSPKGRQQLVFIAPPNRHFEFTGHGLGRERGFLGPLDVEHITFCRRRSTRRIHPGRPTTAATGEPQARGSVGRRKPKGIAELTSHDGALYGTGPLRFRPHVQDVERFPIRSDLGLPSVACAELLPPRRPRRLPKADGIALPSVHHDGDHGLVEGWPRQIAQPVELPSGRRLRGMRARNSSEEQPSDQGVEACHR